MRLFMNGRFFSSWMITQNQGVPILLESNPFSVHSSEILAKVGQRVYCSANQGNKR